MSLASLLVGFLPVVLFLALLVAMDSYRLVRRSAVARALAAGGGAALLALGAHRLALDLGASPELVRRVVAPVLEEILKAAYVVWLVRGGRVGFLVDAAILGFAVGTGFALVENVVYARALGGAGLALWLVRGLGTALLHGSTTAVVALLAQDLAERHGPRRRVVLPGLAVAIAVHAAYNQLLLPPLLAAALLLVAMPLLLYLAFERSERATREWLGASLDGDVELLEQIGSGRIADSPIGHYLESLRARFDGPVVADLLCLLEIHAELAARAKGLLIARAAGVELPADPEVRARLAELRFLRRSVGPTGWMALKPLVHADERDLWQLGVLERR